MPSKYIAVSIYEISNKKCSLDQRVETPPVVELVAVQLGCGCNGVDSELKGLALPRALLVTLGVWLDTRRPVYAAELEAPEVCKRVEHVRDGRQEGLQ